MTAALRCEGLALQFPGGRRIGPLTLALGPGVHHLTGPNGTGKTTLLRCLCGGWRASEGTVDVGAAIRATSRRRGRGSRCWRRRRSCRRSSPSTRRGRSWRRPRRARLGRRALREALGVPGDLPLGHCSAGQRRRAELLAAAAGDPDVLLMDEPFANLDPEATARVVEVVAGWRVARVVVVTSHEALPLPADSVVAL
ncbi:MAG: ABC transporter ATP-binding protein [Myxococcota bacterium]